MKGILTLVKVITETRQAEEITRQVNLQANGPGTDAPLANVYAVGRCEERQRTGWQRRGNRGRIANSKEECSRYGKLQHSDERKCPALKRKCNK